MRVSCLWNCLNRMETWSASSCRRSTMWESLTWFTTCSPSCGREFNWKIQWTVLSLLPWLLCYWACPKESHCWFPSPCLRSLTMNGLTTLNTLLGFLGCSLPWRLCSIPRLRTVMFMEFRYHLVTLRGRNWLWSNFWFLVSLLLVIWVEFLQGLSISSWGVLTMAQTHLLVSSEVLLVCWNGLWDFYDACFHSEGGRYPVEDLLVGVREEFLCLVSGDAMLVRMRILLG